VKVAFYTIATHLGGAERSLLDIVTRLDRQSNGRYTPWVILPQSGGPMVEVLEKNKIEFEVLPFPDQFLKVSRQNFLNDTLKALPQLPHITQYVNQLTKLLKTSSPHLVHTSGIKCHLLAGQTLPWHKTPVLCHLRDILPQGLTLKLLRAMARQKNFHLVANSKSTAHTLAPHPAHVVYNGIDVHRFIPKKGSTFRDHLKLDESTPLVGIVAVLAQWKGQMQFIEMTKQLVNEGSTAHFIIVGDPIYDTSSDENYKDQLTAQIKSLGLQQRVHLVGYIDPPEVAMQGLDIVVHASTKPEAFGRVIIEAMACERPVVAANQGGPTEIIDPGVTGLLYPMGDVDAMAKSVKHLLDNPERREKIGQVARAAVSQRFSVEAMVDGIIKVYDQIEPY